VYLDDYLRLLNAPEQDQGPVNLEPRLVQTNLSVNLLTAPSIGRLAALRYTHRLKDLCAENRGSNSYDSFESQQSTHDLNSARRKQALPFRPTDRDGNRNTRRDGPHSLNTVFRDKLDAEARKKSNERGGGVRISRQSQPDYSQERQLQQREEEENSDSREEHNSPATIVDRRRNPRSNLFFPLQPQPQLQIQSAVQPQDQPVVKPNQQLLNRMVQNLFQDSDDDDLDVGDYGDLGANQNEENIVEEEDVNHVNQHQDSDDDEDVDKQVVNTVTPDNSDSDSL
jgi:hypothetical protein